MALFGIIPLLEITQPLRRDDRSIFLLKALPLFLSPPLILVRPSALLYYHIVPILTLQYSNVYPLHPAYFGTHAAVCLHATQMIMIGTALMNWYERMVKGSSDAIHVR